MFVLPHISGSCFFTLCTLYFCTGTSACRIPRLHRREPPLQTCARYALFLQRHLATRIRVVVGILFMHRPRWLMCTTQLLHDLGFYFPTVQKPKMRCEEFVMFMCTALHCPALISYTRTSSYYYAVVSLLESHSLMELICAVVLPEVAQFLVCLFSRIFVIACFQQIEIALFGRLI